MSVGLAKVRIVETDAQFRAVGFQVFLESLGVGGFLFAGRVVQNADVRIAHLTIEFRGKAMDGKVNDLGRILFGKLCLDRTEKSVAETVPVAFQALLFHIGRLFGEFRVTVVLVAVAVQVDRKAGIGALGLIRALYEMR